VSFAAAAGQGITVCQQSALDQTTNDATAEFDFDDEHDPSAASTTTTATARLTRRRITW